MSDDNPGRATTAAAVACTFCGCRQEGGHRLISGAPGRYICDDCIRICSELLAEDNPPPASAQV